MTLGPYAAMHAASLLDPDGFWAEAARQVDWVEPPKTILDRAAQPSAR